MTTSPPLLPRIVATVGVAAIALGVTACSDDSTAAKKPARATTTSRSATTTVAGGSATTVDGGATPTALGGSDPTTTVALPKAFTVPGEPSPLQLGTGVPEPEYPAGKDGTDPTVTDGKLDLVVQQVDPNSGALLVNVVQLIIGDEAPKAAAADNQLPPDGQLLGNYYVRDLSPKLRVVSVADDVTLTEPSLPKVSGRKAVTARLIERRGIAPQLPYQVTVADGKVVALAVPTVVDPTITG